MLTVISFFADKSLNAMISLICCYSETCLIRPPLGPKFVVLIESAFIKSCIIMIENCGLNIEVVLLVLKTGFTVLLVGCFFGTLQTHYITLV